MEKHHGQTVEYIIRRNGFSLSELAKQLKVNRRSLYNWFQNKYLKRSVIHSIGQIIRHDFSKEFPELFLKDDFNFEMKIKDHNSLIDTNESTYKDKYISLLEKYNEILLEGNGIM